MPKRNYSSKIILLRKMPDCKGILSATTPDQFNLLLSHVIGTDSNPLRQMVVINKGSKDGVIVGKRWLMKTAFWTSR